MTSEPFNPVVLRRLFAESLVELRTEPEEFAQRLANRVEDLRSELDTGTDSEGRLDAIWDVTPTWLQWIPRGLTDEERDQVLVDRPSAEQATKRTMQDELPATRELLIYLRNHPIDLARWRGTRQTG